MKKNNLKRLSIVTFISHAETFNPDILSFYQHIKTHLDFAELIVFTDKEVLQAQKISAPDIHEETDGGATKYKRILNALTMAKYDMILFIDNDISPDLDNIHTFLTEYQDGIDLYFGRIGVTDPKSITERLVEADKILSHKFIRPMLWKFGIGISVPGQIFLLKKESFRKALMQWDTVFDDLSIGACAKDNGYNVQISKLILGHEKASSNLKTLIKQRLRWAKGYSETLKHYQSSRVLPFVVIHGIAYHLVTPVFNVCTLLLATKYSLPALGIWFALCLIISDRHMKYIPVTVLYMLMFPIIHIIWMFALMIYLITHH